MVYHSFDCRSAPVEVNLSHLQGSGGADEYHLTLRPRDYGSIESQLEWVFNAYKEALDAAGLDVGSAVLRRFFCSDLSNQAAALRAHPFSNPGADDPCAVSWVCQPPLSPAKVALWAYHVNDAGRGLDKERDGAVLAVRRGAVSHYWMAGITCPSADTAYGQTRGVFDRYEALLKTRGMTLADNAIRTWIFVRNIDANYHQLAAARREYLAERGLTPETHFVASTGVGWTPMRSRACVPGR
jgi:enamine deaminase RidA (YjgF/YER057c/UK114 family)